MAKSKIDSTLVSKMLKKHGVDFQLHHYVVDESDLSAVHLAQTLKISVDKIYKTLVLEGDKTSYFVCVIAGGLEVDLKKCAQVSANKKVHLLPQKELQKITGYIRGGCSPIGMKKRFTTYFDCRVLEQEKILISAGVRGVQIEIAPVDLIDYVNGVVADIT